MSTTVIVAVLLVGAAAAILLYIARAIRADVLPSGIDPDGGPDNTPSDAAAMDLEAVFRAAPALRGHPGWQTDTSLHRWRQAWADEVHHEIEDLRAQVAEGRAREERVLIGRTLAGLFRQATPAEEQQVRRTVRIATSPLVAERRRTQELRHLTGDWREHTEPMARPVFHDQEMADEAVAA